MNRDQLADWLHCLEGGMHDWVADEIRKELAKPKANQFCPDWDMIKPFHERIAELEAQLEQEPVAWAVLRPDGRVKLLSHQQGVEVDLKWTPLYVAPPRKPWVGLTDTDLMKEFGYTDELLRDTAYRVEQILAGRNT